MIRNHAGNSIVEDTAKLIETLQKVGIIKTKAKRKKATDLAKEEIRQNNDMGPGYAISMPPQFGASPQQQDYNTRRIEDIQRQSSNQIALLRSQLQQVNERDTNRFGLQQRIENVSQPKIEDASPVVIDTNEFEGTNSGPQPDTGSGAKIDFDKETATGIFVGDESVATAAAELTDEEKIQKVIEAFNHEPIPNTVKALKDYIKAVAEQDGVMIGISGTKETLMKRIKSYYLSKYEGLPY